MVNISDAEKLLGVNFLDKDLLLESLTHSSSTNESENRVGCHNERLEFLGDAVIGLVVAQVLYQGEKNRDEGELSSLRSQVVSGESLAGVARRMRLGDLLVLGRGEELDGGRDRNSNLAAALEALIGALFLDRGLEMARSTVSHWLSEEIELANSGEIKQDPKTRLQLLTQSIEGRIPVYKITGQDGPDHFPTFSAVVSIDGITRGSGTGASKSLAERRAAEDALKGIGNHNIDKSES